MRMWSRGWLGLPGAAVLAALWPEAGVAQVDGAAREMRHFWHVFAAFAIAWVLVFGWAVAIARRIRRVEEKLDR